MNVIFQPNIPQELSFRSEPVYLSTEDRVDYILTDGRMMRLSTTAAASINMLEIAPGETFSICKRWNGDRKQAPRWDIWLSIETEKARAAAEAPGLEAQLRQSLAMAKGKGWEQTGNREAAERVAESVIARLQGQPVAALLDAAPDIADEPEIVDSPDVQLTPPHSLDTGTRGPQPLPIPIPKRTSHRVPLNQALPELLGLALDSLKTCGQTWGPTEVQHLVVTLVIESGRQGWLGQWERP